MALTLAALGVFAGSALAERVAVRSGEHEGYSRLVLDLPRPVRWDLKITDETAQLTLSNITADFDLSDAFRRLSSNRILGVDPVAGKSALAITLGCDCKVEAFRVGAQMLVLDISGPEGNVTPASNPDAVDATDPAQTTPEPDRKKVTRRYFFPYEVTTPAAQNGLSFGTFAAAAQQSRATKTEKTADDAPPMAPPATGSQAHETSITSEMERNQRLSEAERRLARQLSRAASQGLVTPRAAQLPKTAAPAKDTPKPGLDTAESHANLPGNHSNATPGLNLRAQSSADQDMVKILNALPQTGNGDRCFSDAELDVATWAKDSPFGAQVGALRAELVGEFDRPNQSAARQLVKLYIHYGFGAEALHVLRTTDLSGGGTMLLKSMAEIMEYGHARGPGPLTSQLDCDTTASLWSVLAHDPLPPSAKIDAPAVLRGVNALPPHLRSHLGPTLSTRLIDAGFEDLATQVLRLVERGHDAPDARFNMADADLRLAEGDVTTASDVLDSVIDTNTEHSPKALVTLIDARIEAGLPLDIQTADLAGAFALEYRNDPLGAELKRVHILALAEAGAFDAAFAELPAFSSDAPTAVARETLSHTMATLAHKAGDVPFLKYALEPRAPGQPALAANSANAVAERLIALGFAPQADAYLHYATDPADDTDRRLLRARSALAQQKPRRAEADLLGLSGPDADLLRAEARSLSGDHATARQLFAALGRDEDMLTEAWLASDWDQLRQSDDPLWQEAAAMAAPDLPPAAPDTGVLTRNHALIDASQSARDTMANLLAQTPVEALPPASE